MKWPLISEDISRDQRWPTDWGFLLPLSWGSRIQAPMSLFGSGHHRQPINSNVTLKYKLTCLTSWLRVFIHLSWFYSLGDLLRRRLTEPHFSELSTGNGAYRFPSLCLKGICVFSQCWKTPQRETKSVKPQKRGFKYKCILTLTTEESKKSRKVMPKNIKAFFQWLGELEGQQRGRPRRSAWLNLWLTCRTGEIDEVPLSFTLCGERGYRNRTLQYEGEGSGPTRAVGSPGWLMGLEALQKQHSPQTEPDSTPKITWQWVSSAFEP